MATNRLLEKFRRLFRWAIEKEILDTSPFSRHGVAVIKLDRKAEHARTRRLECDEEMRLLQHAGPHLHACIVAALETGMRKGEILGLQWQHVHLDNGTLSLPASITKSDESRTVVITPRLEALLHMRQLVPDGQPPLPLAHVFGNAVGDRIKNIRTAWKLTCQRAGITGLHFHDLRREAGSRLLETPGVSQHEVRDFLGHQQVTTTNRYLASSPLRLREALRRRDESRTNLAHGPVRDNGQPKELTVTH